MNLYFQEQINNFLIIKNMYILTLKLTNFVLRLHQSVTGEFSSRFRDEYSFKTK